MCQKQHTKLAFPRALFGYYSNKILHPASCKLLFHLQSKSNKPAKNAQQRHIFPKRIISQVKGLPSKNHLFPIHCVPLLGFRLLFFTKQTSALKNASDHAMFLNPLSLALYKSDICSPFLIIRAQESSPPQTRGPFISH